MALQSDRRDYDEKTFGHYVKLFDEHETANLGSDAEKQVIEEIGFEAFPKSVTEFLTDVLNRVWDQI